MAQRRMFSKSITNSSSFQMMSPSAQSLYFHIGMNADDDGFCEIFTVVRMTESKPDDLRSLHEREFIYILDNKVAIVKDWHENNYIQADRYTMSKHLKDPKIANLYKTVMSEKIKDLQRYNGLDTKCIQVVSKVDTQVRIGLGKGRVGEGRVSLLDKDNLKDIPILDSQLGLWVEFWKEYPLKKAVAIAKKSWAKINPSDELAKKIIEDVKKRRVSDREWLEGFIPHPSTYLNQERWNDDITPPRTKGLDNKGPEFEEGKYDNVAKII